MRARALTIIGLLGALCARADLYRDTIELQRKDSNTWTVIVWPATSFLITNFTALQFSTNATNWQTIAPVRRENAVRYFEVTNAPQMFFQLLNSPVGKHAI